MGWALFFFFGRRGLRGGRGLGGDTDTYATTDVFFFKSLNLQKKKKKKGHGVDRRPNRFSLEKKEEKEEKEEREKKIGECRPSSLLIPDLILTNNCYF